MDNPAQLKTQVFNMGVKWPGQSFNPELKYLPLAGKYDVNGASEPAIGDYLEPPTSGTYVLGSVGGQIQWIETEACDE